ncbi:1-deoxy-D-xylulose 5-phosphate reductoisomerase [Thermodesulfatator indicus DSM 15286]|uniref:1-deoxy-D-xylulose 5-phosphate reductoisomerase n=1 Tax=Thermodesulfatator indicus (strain DSM 15286 / JCM 11887 / CIR29812) TaxID=667014 RepID=F8ADC2_THEID|nr:1-deoxy-D-xylulose-5-phosphate reductoisomerase [Thermodesulfatator indicus]AEH45937.1 1-deoxy-D-xylulose 5-phosphate reductoisomerase [Thermodesulfatator indicus DSM 15286]
MAKKIAILGSTGSIGRSTLEVVEAFPDRFKVVALTAGENIELLAKQAEKFKPLQVACKNEYLAEKLKPLLPKGVKLLHGKEGIIACARHPEVESVVSALVGSAGLLPTFAAVEAGKTLALANKESLVMAGKLLIEKARETGSQIIPVDSEHSAIFQALQAGRAQEVNKIILTASGGPFRERPKETFNKITPEEALKHPNWRMGPKITIDSATLMNKGLEVIEAHFLFNVPPEKIDVVIHPQSIVHSLVEFVDGSVIAQLGVPDMRVPIAYALSYPERLPLPFPKLDLVKASPLTFEVPDLEKFPCLALAYEALRLGGTAPAVLNAANEVAVEVFLEGRLRFDLIPEVIRETLVRADIKEPSSIDEVINADIFARIIAHQIIDELEKD